MKQAKKEHIEGERKDMFFLKSICLEENPRAIKKALRKVLLHYGKTSTNTAAQKTEVFETLRHLDKMLDEIIATADRTIDAYFEKRK